MRVLIPERSGVYLHELMISLCRWDGDCPKFSPVGQKGGGEKMLGGRPRDLGARTWGAIAVQLGAARCALAGVCMHIHADHGSFALARCHVGIFEHA